jgi:putative NADPH-quinone reductase
VKRALVLFAHPCPESFSAALHDKVVDRLTTAGWHVDDCDLNAEGFNPVLTEAERRGYHEEPENIGPVARYVERVRAADALIMVFPVWNFGYPAILKGFLDRVFLPGVSFKLEEGQGEAEPHEDPEARGRHHLWRHADARDFGGGSAPQMRHARCLARVSTGQDEIPRALRYEPGR